MKSTRNIGKNDFPYLNDIDFSLPYKSSVSVLIIGADDPDLHGCYGIRQRPIAI